MQIPARVTSVANNAFFNRVQTIPLFITKLTFVEGSQCSTITSHVFELSPLTSADLSKCINLTSISEMAFYNCSALTSVSFPSSLQMIGESAFETCDALTSADLSKCVDLSSVIRLAFYSCSSLHSITFPGSLQSIGDNAFTECSSLKEIV